MAEFKKKSNDVNTERIIEGFDINLTREKLERIDRLVDNYENIIVARLDDEYTRRQDVLTVWRTLLRVLGEVGCLLLCSLFF